ncbi:hypothetical protein STEG23_007654, partial [Scotinomys teguina]
MLCREQIGRGDEDGIKEAIGEAIAECLDHKHVTLCLLCALLRVKSKCTDCVGYFSHCWDQIPTWKHSFKGVQSIVVEKEADSGEEECRSQPR